MFMMIEHEMTAGAAKTFMTAGNATFTLESVSTGVRYTYKVKAAKPNPDYPGTEPMYFVSVLTGPDNTSDYTYIGKVQREKFSLTKASKMGPESGPVKAFAWTLAKLAAGESVEGKVKVYHLNHCGRCGRELTVPSSVEAGIGPECANKMAA